MKISIITIVYNDKKNICRTINSVTSQTARKNIEYIIVDGASTDGTSELIKQKLNDIDIYICEPDDGIYDAMNKGIDCASGDFVIFMNSGDNFSNLNVISDVINAMIQSKNIPYLVYGDYREIRQGVCSAPIPSRKYNKIWYGPVASHQSCFYNRAFLNTLNLRYDTNYKIAADYKLTLAVIHAANRNILQLPICISDFDISGLSNTNQNLGLKEANQARKEILGWGIFKESLLTILLLCARYTKHYANPIYKKLRRL